MINDQKSREKREEEEEDHWQVALTETRRDTQHNTMLADERAFINDSPDYSVAVRFLVPPMRNANGTRATMKLTR